MVRKETNHSKREEPNINRELTIGCGYGLNKEKAEERDEEKPFHWVSVVRFRQCLEKTKQERKEERMEGWKNGSELSMDMFVEEREINLYRDSNFGALSFLK